MHALNLYFLTRMASPWNFHTAFFIPINQDQTKDGLNRKWECCQMFALDLSHLLYIFTYYYKHTMVVFHCPGMQNSSSCYCYRNCFHV